MVRDINSISASDVLIEDPIMEPFFITKSQSYGYTLYERMQGESKRKTTKVAKPGKEYVKTVGYYSSFAGCLNRITKELIHYGEVKQYSTIKQYIESYSDIQQNLISVVEL